MFAGTGNASERDGESSNTSEGSSGTEYDDVNEETVKPSVEDSPADPLVQFESDIIPGSIAFFISKPLL